MEPTKLSIEEMELECELSPKERLEMAIELASTLEAISEVEKRAHEDAVAHKESIKALEEKVGYLRPGVRSGVVKRQVAVEHWADHEKAIVRSIRQDNKQVIRERMMTMDERQLPMPVIYPLVPATKEKPKKSRARSKRSSSPTATATSSDAE